MLLIDSTMFHRSCELVNCALQEWLYSSRVRGYGSQGQVEGSLVACDGRKEAK